MNIAVGRILAFDWGLRNVGVAVGNAVLKTAEPCTVIRAKDGVPDWSDIEKLINTWQPDLLLVGEPLNMDGSDSDMASHARRFARRLEGRFGVSVALVDERLSSQEAKTQRRDRGGSADYVGQPVDAEAACIILSTWLSEN